MSDFLFSFQSSFAILVLPDFCAIQLMTVKRTILANCYLEISLTQMPLTPSYCMTYGINYAWTNSTTTFPKENN